MSNDYATASDLQARFVDTPEVAYLTDSTDPNTPVTAVLDEVLDAAALEIDSYLANRYKVPVDVTTHANLAAFLKSKTLDLAEVALLLRHETLTGDKTEQRDRTIRLLEGIRDGKNHLPATSVPSGTVSRPDVAKWGQQDANDDGNTNRVFTRGTVGKL